jgi:phage baseplate assembly protein W
MSYDLKIVNGDLVIQNGQIQTITGTEKLAQDILKIVLSQTGSDLMNPWYGSLINKSLIGTATDSIIISTVGQSQVRNAVSNLQNLQINQTHTSQVISPQEHIAIISEVSLKQDVNNPTLYIGLIKVLTKALTPVNVSFPITTI